MKKDQSKLLFLSSLGGILEFYDFIIFALFAGYIADAFYPQSKEIGLLIAFATFAIGYLVRPIGGIIFGHFGDRKGRKSTFTISILLMAIATLCIGLVPTYTAIGIYAPCLITLLRMLQGFSIGGEIPGSIAYVSESLPNKKGLACGIIFCSLTLGIVLGSLTHALIIYVLTPTQMHDYGFRLPFIFGGIFGLCSFFLRRGLHESSQFLNIKKEVEKLPIVVVFEQEFRHALAGTFIIALCAGIITQLFLFVPSYFTKILLLKDGAFIWERTASIALGSLLSLFFGYLSDFISVKKLMLALGLTTLLLAYPIFAIYVYCPNLYYLAFFASSILMGFSAGVAPSLLANLFPTKIRFSGIAASYNLGFAIFGGLTPFISLSLIYYTGIATMPALYLIILSLLSIIAVISTKKFNATSEIDTGPLETT